MPVEDPNFGKAFPCQCTQKEFEQSRIVRLQRYSHLGDLARLTFSNLIPSGRGSNPASQRRFLQAYAAATAFAEKPDGWLVFLGPSGCGKTHLAAAITNQRLQEGFLVLFMVVPDLLDHLRAAFAPDSPVAYDELLEQVKSAPMLVLDDLGTHNATPWAQEKLYQVLNYRFNSMLPTIVTARSMDDLDAPLRTRLQDPRVSHVFTLEVLADVTLERLNELDSSRIAEMTFEAFDPRGLGPIAGPNSNLQNIFRIVRQWAEDPQGWLVLMGEQGCGKTHLAAASAHMRRQRGEETLLVSVPTLLDHLRSTFSPDSNITYDQQFERVKNVAFLVLDDFGEHNTKPWASEKLYQLINHRYNQRLPTVITYPLNHEDSEKLKERREFRFLNVDERIASRMSEAGFSRLLHIIAPDYRRGVPRTGTEPEAAGPRETRRRTLPRS